MRYYATEAQLDQAEYARSIGGRILNYFEEYFNISYPLPKAGLSSKTTSVIFGKNEKLILHTEFVITRYTGCRCWLELPCKSG